LILPLADRYCPSGVFHFHPCGDLLAYPSQITQLLRSWSDGDPDALRELVPLLYERLRQAAHARLRNAAGGSMNTTGLVHETYLKLAAARHVRLEDRAQFLALASRTMRNVLVDQARARKALKRGGGFEREEFEEPVWVSEDVAEVVSQLDDALNRLKLLDSRQSQLLEQRYFGGLSLEETAAAAGLSLATVKRELRSARAWLAGQVKRELT
jgi:RNA polymerase sigma factor (TIGR02999 family)